MCFFKAKTSFDFACFCCLLCLKSPVMVSLTPMPSGGGCRPQGRPERENVTGPRCKMTATVGVCERFYRLQAVTFSLFRHPPRGGSADATFPRWGKERTAANSPDVAASLWCCCGTSGTTFPTIKCCKFSGGGGLSSVLLPGRRGRV